MKRIFQVSLLLSVVLNTTSMAQSGQKLNKAQEEVMAVVFELFDGYRDADSARVSTTFAKNAQMQRVQTKDGQTIVTPAGSVQGWLNYIGAGLDKTHDEPIWDYTVNIDNGLASVWTRYAFYLDGKFHHCGVDNFLLVDSGDGWKIFHIVDTSQEVECEVPEAVRQKSETN